MADADVEARGPHRCTCARRQVLVSTVQNLLVLVCLLTTLYVYWNEPAFVDNVHIHFDTISDVLGNCTLQFDYISSMNMMNLTDDKRQNIQVNCTGPYVLYVDTCYKTLDAGKQARGVLKLQVVGSKDPISSFHMNTSGEVCDGLHRQVYLRANQLVNLRLTSFHAFKMKRATVGLTYLLGTKRQCFARGR